MKIRDGDLPIYIFHVGEHGKGHPSPSTTGAQRLQNFWGIYHPASKKDVICSINNFHLHHIAGGQGAARDVSLLVNSLHKVC